MIDSKMHRFLTVVEVEHFGVAVEIGVAGCEKRVVYIWIDGKWMLSSSPVR